MSTVNSTENPGRSFEESLEKYQVYSPLEIGRILRGLQTGKQLLRMSFAGTMETVITHVLDVDVKEKQVILDSPLVPAQVDIATKSSMINFEGVLDRIKISFTVGRVRQHVFEEEPAFLVPFPERLVRLQRREHFRVPVFNSTVRIPVEIDGRTIYSMGNIRDLSQNGLSIVDNSMMMDDTVNRIYPNCRLELPDVQPLTVTLEVRNSHEVTLPNLSSQRRIGCRFIGLSAAEAALIQRYITRQERQRKTMLVD